MAKKRKTEEAPQGSPAWMATFSDLMNLLLCFFVLLFSMSSVDSAKFDELAASFAKSFSIFSSGGASIGEGQLISAGVKQLNNLGEFYSNFGVTTDSEEDEDSLEKYKEEMEQERKEATEETYEKVTASAAQSKVNSYIEVNMDEGYQYVRISISGKLLFASGKEEIREEAIPILNKIGDILKQYDDRLIKIEGHTDNVPISNSRYKNNMRLSQARACSVWEYLTNVKHLDESTLEASGRGEYNPIADNSTVEGREKNRRVEFKIYTEVD